MGRTWPLWQLRRAKRDLGRLSPKVKHRRESSACPGAFPVLHATHDDPWPDTFLTHHVAHATMHHNRFHVLGSGGESEGEADGAGAATGARCPRCLKPQPRHAGLSGWITMPCACSDTTRSDTAPGLVTEECPVCMERKPRRAGRGGWLAMPCGCYACASCVRDHTANQCQGSTRGNPWPFTCPVCVAPVPNAALRKLVSQALFNKALRCVRLRCTQGSCAQAQLL